MFESTPELWIGRVIDGRYRITELIGEGGMGSVFAAEHLTLHRSVAIKIVRPEYAGNAELARRFAREAMVTSRIDHPNVISAIDFGELDDGCAYLTMQLVRGRGVHEILAREGSLHWSRAASIGAQVADALSAAQAEGIVHRDLKPENILVQSRDDGNDLVKVLDFGIAKFTRDSLAPPSMRGGAQQVTQTGVVIGTPGYMAPEQAVGQRADHRSDLYALVVILWECLVGRRMWGGDDAREIIKSQLRGRPPSPRTATGDLTIPEEFDTLVMQLCDDTPDARPTDAAAVREQLRSLALRGRGMSVRPRGLRATRGPDAAAPATTLDAGGNVEDSGMVQALLEQRETATPLTGESPAPLRARRRLSMLSIVALLTIVGAGALVATGQLSLEPQGDLRRVTERIAPGSKTKASAAAAQAAEALPARPIGTTGLPLELEPVLAALVQDETRSGRVGAARRLLGHIPMEEVPAYVRGIAQMQLAKTCKDKKANGLALLSELRDHRTLPALVLASDRAKDGCGPKGRSRDCLGCMREELDTLIAELRSGQSPTP